MTTLSPAEIFCIQQALDQYKKDIIQVDRLKRAEPHKVVAVLNLIEQIEDKLKFKTERTRLLI